MQNSWDTCLFQWLFLAKENLYSEDSNEILIKPDLAHHEECTLLENKQTWCVDEIKAVTYAVLSAGTHQHKIYSSE